MDFMRKTSNVLFIYISFFEYEKEIIRNLKKFNYKIYSFDERISNLKIVKVIYRFVPILGRILTTIHFFRFYLKIKSINKLDYLFLLKGEVTPKWFIKKLIKLFPKIKTIYYTWDSFENNPNGLSLIKLFDKKISFDYSDSKKYNLQHRPLFSSISPRKNKAKRNFTLAASVLTVHSDRISILANIIAKLKEHGIYTKYYAYSRIKQIDIFKKSLVSNVTFKIQSKPLKKNDLIEFLNDANFIIDINHPNQKGLTMRTFEALVASKKLITTNASLKKYSFFKPNNILIVDRKNIQISKKFIKSKFHEYDKDLIERMTLEGWLREIFSNLPKYKWIK